jgi:hypothetical protein
MGTWATGLYGDDDAADLRDTIGVLTKLPVDGNRILEILVEGRKAEEDAEHGTAFWLVVADQFERKGITCPPALAKALDVIRSGADLRDWKERGAGKSDLAKRAKVLETLAERLRSPRPARPRPKATKPPPFIVDVGEVYAFPTMGERSHNAWFPSWEADRFVPDGWGALLILARGRVYDWLPWCATSALSVPRTDLPTLEKAVNARLYSRQGGTLCVPRRSHVERMGMQLLGRLELDPGKASAAISNEHTPEYAVRCDWSFIAQARAWNETFPGGIPVSALLGK